MKNKFIAAKSSDIISHNSVEKYQYHRHKYSHSKSQMTPIKISGINVDPGSVKKSANIIPVISVTRNGAGFKSVETQNKSHVNSFSN